MALTKEEKAILIEKISELIETNDNILVIITCIDSQQDIADGIVSASGRWSRASLDFVVANAWNELTEELTNQGR